PGADGAAETLAAMRDGADVIYQAPLAGGRWHGRADFLLKTRTPSTLGPWSYEVVDAKLATETRASTVLPPCVTSAARAHSPRAPARDPDAARPRARFFPAADAFAARPVPRSRGRPARGRRRPGISVRRGRHGRHLHAALGYEPGGGETRVRAGRRPDRRSSRRAPRHPRLSLRAV